MNAELPPLPQLIVAKAAGFVTMSYTARSVEALESAREARERILMERIAELQEEADRRTREVEATCHVQARLNARIAELEADAERLNYIERTFAGCTTQDRYLPIRMIWGKGCNGRTLREACDKYMARDAAIDAARGEE